jgi:multidrug efflux pump subunit AcrB
MGLIGVVVGLLVTNQPFGFMTLVGVVSLTGIVVNNAIILIDRIRINLDIKGLSAQESIVEASLNRLRPILLTTVTTIGGILPLYFRGNPTFQPMSVAIIFGLLFATLLVLGIVPLLYAVLFHVDFREFTNSD